MVGHQTRSLPGSVPLADIARVYVGAVCVEVVCVYRHGRGYILEHVRAVHALRAQTSVHASPGQEVTAPGAVIHSMNENRFFLGLVLAFSVVILRPVGPCGDEMPGVVHAVQGERRVQLEQTLEVEDDIVV